MMALQYRFREVRAANTVVHESRRSLPAERSSSGQLCSKDWSGQLISLNDIILGNDDV